jgi:AcrR family transcriptional regulator
LAAAADEFAPVGDVAATVSQIAKDAGVTVPTLYLAWGSKRALLCAFLESSLATTLEQSGRYHAAQLHPDSPAGTIAQIAELFCDVAQRIAIAWRACSEGAAVDKAIAEEWLQVHKVRHATFTALLASVPDEAMRITRQDAIDTAWALASPDVYELMVCQGDYTLERFQDWLTTTLQIAILRSPPGESPLDEGSTGAAASPPHDASDLT